MIDFTRYDAEHMLNYLISNYFEQKKTALIFFLKGVLLTNRVEF